MSSSYSYQSNNRLTATSAASYGYNANGNLTSKTISSTSWTYVWDYENRMTSASDGTTTASYEYDALGRRTKRTQGTTTTKFIYDGQDVLVDDNGGTLTKYLNGLGIDNKLRVQTGSDIKYFLTDHLGSTNGLADLSGSVTDSTAYDSFGNATNSSFPTRYQFTGREYDSFTGLHYYRARWYDAQLGRFISEDPIGFKGKDINLYGYVWNSPIKLIDPQGTDGGASLVLGGGAAVGAGGAVGAAAAGAGIGLGIGAIWYGAWLAGEWIAEQPWNPLTHPRPTPFPDQSDKWSKMQPVPFPNQSENCDSTPRVIPFDIGEFWEPQPHPDREGCWQEISDCNVECSEAQGNPNLKGFWGGSMKNCMKGCVSERCKKGTWLED